MKPYRYRVVSLRLGGVHYIEREYVVQQFYVDESSVAEVRRKVR